MLGLVAGLDGNTGNAGGGCGECGVLDGVAEVTVTEDCCGCSFRGILRFALAAYVFDADDTGGLDRDCFGVTTSVWASCDGCALVVDMVLAG